jgi:hypothetical protein
MAVERGAHVIRVERTAPGRLDPDHLSPGPRRHARHPLAEVTVRRDEHDVARLHEVRDRSLHRRRAGAADGNRPAVPGAERVPEQLLHLVHQAEKGRVQVADERGAHRPQHARVDVARAGSHQQAVRRARGRELRCGVRRVGHRIVRFGYGSPGSAPTATRGAAHNLSRRLLPSIPARPRVPSRRDQRSRPGGRGAAQADHDRRQQPRGEARDELVHPGLERGRELPARGRDRSPTENSEIPEEEKRVDPIPIARMSGSRTRKTATAAGPASTGTAAALFPRHRSVAGPGRPVADGCVVSSPPSTPGP